MSQIILSTWNLHPHQISFIHLNWTFIQIIQQLSMLQRPNVVFYLTKITGQHLKDLMSRPGNTVYQRHIKIDFKVDVDQCVIMLKNIYRFTISNQKNKDVPYLCRKFYSLGPCTLESGIHYLELVQASLHRHKYTFFTDHRCDVVQLVSCLYPGHLKNQLHQATQKEEYSWTELKLLADEIVASLKASRMQCYDSLPGGKQVPPFNPVVPPLSPPLKSGSTIPPTSTVSPSISKVLHKALSTEATSTTTGISIQEPYQPIKANPAYEGKQRMPCVNCKSDVPSRHYYQQCQQLCQYSTCSNFIPHFGNNCPQLIAQGQTSFSCEL